MELRQLRGYTHCVTAPQNPKKELVNHPSASRPFPRASSPPRVRRLLSFVSCPASWLLKTKIFFSSPGPPREVGVRLVQESRHAQDEEKEDQTRHEDPLAAHHHHLRDGRHGPSGEMAGKDPQIGFRRDPTVLMGFRIMKRSPQGWQSNSPVYRPSV